MLPSDLPAPPRRRPDASKHDHGRVVVVGGAVGMAGAPALAAMAALRAGAGLVELVTPDAITAVAASFDPCVMTSGLPTSAAGTFAARAATALDDRARRATALAVGPGMGRSDDVVELVGRLWHEVACAAVFDADALWALSRLPRETLRRHAGPRVVTPHAGEMARLVGHDAPPRLGRGPLEAAAGDLARDTDVVVVLKGAGTLVVAPGREARNETGNPGLATAGTGDVLSGIVTALLAQGLEPFAAARLGVWLHGRSGDVAAATLGEWSLTARDVIERLHLAFLEAAGGSPGVAR